MNRGTRTVFLGGAPGAGKTTTLAEVTRQRPDVAVFTAGQLIRKGLGDRGSYVRPPVVDHEVAAFYQRILIEVFDRIRQDASGPVILDGHFAVPTSAGPAPVATEVFHGLGVQHLALINTPVNELERRLVARGGAAWWDGSHEMVVALSTSEAQQASAVARRLGLPLLHATSETAVGAILKII